MAKYANQAKPSNDAYTGMLAISLLALIAGAALLWLDYSRYPTTKPPKVTTPRTLDIEAPPAKKAMP